MNQVNEHKKVLADKKRKVKVQAGASLTFHLWVIKAVETI